ncbi:tetraspanin-9-like [Lingula anatina]|uniref:Tetraspanin-9-like n=1 Tax=Lingula anatina TaxID=7574 RepID=A0A1S3J4V0_LINAN|nr:tetraspanin-9-like [Lingula anatina]|eukprot:XP_013405308.1 tetraspanin-9-like [Lingula anatina]
MLIFNRIIYSVITLSYHKSTRTSQIVAGLLAAALFVLFGGDTLSSTLAPLLNPIGADSLPIGEILKSGAYVLIGVGALVLILGFLGCCGAICKSVCMIDFYAGIVALLLIVEIVLVVLFFVIEDKVDQQLKDWLNVTLVNNFQGLPIPISTDNIDALSLGWSFLQISFNCCGINNYTDLHYATQWNRNVSDNFTLQLNYLLNTPNATQRLELAPSCCKMNGQFPDVTPVDISCLVNPNTTNANIEKGCYQALKDALLSNSELLMGVGIAVGAVELGVVVLSCFLCSAFNNEKKIRPAEPTKPAETTQPAKPPPPAEPAAKTSS